MSSFEDDAGWLGLVHHGDPERPFVDRLAEFSVVFPDAGTIGPGPLHPRGVLGTVRAAATLSSLWVEVGGAPALPLVRRRVEHRPWSVREWSEILSDGGPIEVGARHVFLDGRTLLSEYAFTNRSTDAVRIAPIWAGVACADEPSGVAAFYFGEELARRVERVEVHGRSLVFGLDPTPTGSQLPAIGFRLESPHIGLAPWRGPAPRWVDATEGEGRAYALVAEPVALPFGGTHRVQIRCEMAVGETWSSLDWPARARSSTDMDWAETSSRKVFLLAIGADKPPRAISAALKPHVISARVALHRCAVRPRAGHLRGRTLSLCSPGSNDFSSMFFWDSLFSSVALSTFNPDHARDAIAACFVNQDQQTGASPERRFTTGGTDDPRWRHPQSPVASWAVSRCHAESPDEQFLTDIYPALRLNHRYWTETCDADGDGLSEYRWSGQVADDSPLWDPHTDFSDGAGCGVLPPVASVTLNSFLHLDALHLAEIAETLGLDDESRAHRAAAASLAERLAKICYIPDELRYWDYDHGTGMHRRVKTFFMFWPLVCGVPTPAEAARELIEDVLLNPADFYGAVPFPSVAYSEPDHHPNGYWRGRSWPHISYWLLCMLSRFGYGEAADCAASRLIAAQTRFGAALENLSTDPLEEDQRAFCDYNWANAAVVLMGERRYRETAALLPASAPEPVLRSPNGESAERSGARS